MDETLQKAKKSLNETKVKTLEQSLTLINGAFALIAALAWNEAIKSLIDKYFKAGNGLYSKFAYAVIITLLVVFVTSKVTKYLKKLEPENDQANQN